MVLPRDLEAGQELITSVLPLLVGNHWAVVGSIHAQNIMIRIRLAPLIELHSHEDSVGEVLVLEALCFSPLVRVVGLECLLESLGDPFEFVEMDGVEDGDNLWSEEHLYDVNDGMLDLDGRTEDTG